MYFLVIYISALISLKISFSYVIRDPRYINFCNIAYIDNVLELGKVGSLKFSIAFLSLAPYLFRIPSISSLYSCSSSSVIRKKYNRQMQAGNRKRRILNWCKI